MSEHRMWLVTARSAVGALLIVGSAAQADIGDRRCVDQINHRGRTVSRAQNLENHRCILKEGGGLLGAAPGRVEACLAAPKPSLDRRTARVVTSLLAGRCAGQQRTDLVTDALTIATAHQDEPRQLTHDLFGADLDAGQLLQTKPASTCQEKVALRAGQLFDAWANEFRRCKVQAIRDGATTTAEVVAACLTATAANGVGSSLADGGDRIRRRAGKLAEAVQVKCIDRGLDPDLLLPGLCAGGGPQGDLTACLQDAAECRACEAMKRADALSGVSCDLVDNGAADGSCRVVLYLANESECEVLNNEECLLPYPSSRFLVPAATDTGVRVQLPQVGMPAVNGPPVSPAPANELDGFSPTSQILMHFPQGVDLAQSGASRLLAAGCCGQPAGPPWIDTRTHDARSLDLDSPSVLLDADTGDRVLHFLEKDARANSNPQRQVLFMRPGKSLVPGHRYVVAMRNLKTASGADIVAEPAFAALRDGVLTVNPGVESRRAAMEANVFAPLTAAGIDRNQLVLAFDFVVQSEAQLTRQMLSMRDQAFAWLATVEANPTQVTFSVSSTTTNNCATPGQVVWRTVRGTFQSPLFLTGQPTSSTVPVLNVDANDLPVQNGFMNADFDISIPCSVFDPMVASRPIVLGHGLFGDGSDMTSFVPPLWGQFADWTYIAGATDWRGLSSVDYFWVGSYIVGTSISQLNNIRAFPDRLRQGMLNTLVLTRMMKLGLFNRHASFETSPGVGVFPGPTEEMYYYGISLGGIMGTWLSALTPDIERFAVDVPAINFSCLLQRSSQFAPFDVLLAGIGLTDKMHAVIGIELIHEVWVSAEPAGYARHITTDPLPGSGTAKRILMTPAWLDKQVSNTCTEAAARTLGLANLVDGSIQQALPEIPDAAGPLDSAVVMYDTGSFDLFNPLHQPHIPALANLIPTSRCDPHGARPAMPAAIEQLVTFLQPGGQAENFCNGLCDGGDPSEIALGASAPCDPLNP